MREREPTNYLGERIRELVAADDGQLGIEVEITADSVIIRGLVDSEHRRIEVLATVSTRAGGRRVIDELEAPGHDHAAQLRDAERIVP